MHPHKSTTHKELFFHINTEEIIMPRDIKAVTIFCRKEGDYWYATAAKCSPLDQFCRRTGRIIARRRYFSQPAKRRIINVGEGVRPTYYEALDTFIEG